ncbi:MAG: hypothetical protein IJM02_04850 [Clostridia bacterium]|nr:hypothetical protein [Clostridia bacterium]
MKKIGNIIEYVDSLKQKTPLTLAKKRGFIIARKGKENEEIATYVSNGILETVNTVILDENGEPGIVVSMADSDGKKIIDDNGHTNTYIVDRNTFNEKYLDADKVSEDEQLFKPKGGTQEFIQTSEDISFTAPWGKEENLKAGGFLNITNLDNIYGIAYEEFMRTYTILSETE